MFMKLSFSINKDVILKGYLKTCSKPVLSISKVKNTPTGASTNPRKLDLDENLDFVKTYITRVKCSQMRQSKTFALHKFI